MKLERLTLNGITRFSKPVSVDFDQLPEGALVAIVGENGSGKSTILDSTLAAIYREMPSRGEKPLISYASGKNAYIEEIFTVGPTRYKARVSMDAVTGRADAALHREMGGAWIPINDGKVSTFKTAVADRFLPLPVVLASAFAAQNKAGSFLTMDRAGRKDLFSSLLGLAHYEAMAETCRAAALKLEKRRAELTALLFRINAEMTPDKSEATLIEVGKVVEDELADAQAQKMFLASEKPKLVAAVDASLDAMHKASAGLDEHRRLLLERDRLATLMANLDEDIARTKRTAVATIERLQARYEADVKAKEATIKTIPTDSSLTVQLAKRIADIDDKETRDVAVLNTKIENNQTELIDKSDAIKNAVKRLAELDYDISVLRGQLVSARQGVEAAENTLRLLDRNLLALSGAQGRLDAAMAAAALIDEVPCGGKGPYESCQLLAAAKTAKDSIPALETSLALYFDAEAAVDNQRTEVKLAKSIVTGREKQIADTEGFRAQHVVLAGRHEALEVAVKRVEELREQIAVVQNEAVLARRAQQEQTQAAFADADAQRTRMEAEIAQIIERAREDVATERKQADDRITELLQKIEDANTTLTKTKTAIEATANVETEHAAAMKDYQARRTALDAHNDDIAKNAAYVAKCEAAKQTFDKTWAECKAKIAEKAGYEAELAPIEQDFTEFEVLAKCFGREGLPVLEIDAAGPAVSDLTNDLLLSCFDSSRFTVELITQQPKADGKGYKEVFELRVYDAERGGEPRDLTDLSGGEQIIIDEALKGAIAIFVNQQNATPIATCWRDETTGALDPENAIRYVRLLRRLQQRGNFNLCLFITHNEEAAALADVQLVVADGNVTVRHAPFSEAA